MLTKSADIVVADPAADPERLEAFAFRAREIDRKLALHPRASETLLRRLATSADKATRRNIVSNPQTPKDVLLKLAPTFPGEFFRNPVFDLLFLDDPDLPQHIPLTVMKNIIKRPDCPESFVEWAVKRGGSSLHLAVAGKPDVSYMHLKMVAGGPYVKAAEAASARLMTWQGARHQGEGGVAETAQPKTAGG